MSEPCPVGYHRDLSGKCIKDITPPAPTLVAESESEEQEAPDED